MRGDLHLQKWLFISIFAMHGEGWGGRRGGRAVPVSTFIVASEDIAIVSKQKSPTYQFLCLLLVSAQNSPFGRGRRHGKGLICLT